jgi:hypothetical protein
MPFGLGFHPDSLVLLPETHRSFRELQRRIFRDCRNWLIPVFVATIIRTPVALVCRCGEP